jgi:imidazolonepropionase-like amidohydrolase
LAPEIPAQEIWKLATTNAARALQLDGIVGRLSVGAQADVVTFHVRSDHPLEEILEDSATPTAVLMAGG